MFRTDFWQTAVLAVKWFLSGLLSTMKKTPLSCVGWRLWFRSDNSFFVHQFSSDARCAAEATACERLPKICRCRRKSIFPSIGWFSPKKKNIIGRSLSLSLYSDASVAQPKNQLRSSFCTFSDERVLSTLGEPNVGRGVGGRMSTMIIFFFNSSGRFCHRLILIVSILRSDDEWIKNIVFTRTKHYRTRQKWSALSKTKCCSELNKTMILYNWSGVRSREIAEHSLTPLLYSLPNLGASSPPNESIIFLSERTRLAKFIAAE